MKNMSIGERVKLADFVDQSILNKKMFIEVLGEEELDITCFGLDSEEKLSDDRYMIFYNQLVSPNSEILANLTNSKKSIFEIDLNRLPANIKKLVFTLTLDSNKEIRNIKPIKLNIGNGIETSIQFVVKGEDFRNEKAIILAEVYFKDLWRLNAVAKGFDGGLSALLKHFGGEEIVEEKKVEEIKSSINLTKGSSISLDKDQLNGICSFGLGWDVADNYASSIDLDASCLCFSNGNLKNIIYFGNKDENIGISLNGDNLTGEGDGDDEVITIDFSKIPASINNLFFTITSYSGQNFNLIHNAFCRLVNSKGNELFKYKLSEASNKKAVIMLLVKRENNNKWTFKSIGEFRDGKVARDLVSYCEELISN